jgi:hypothetical protein
MDIQGLTDPKKHFEKNRTFRHRTCKARNDTEPQV